MCTDPTVHHVHDSDSAGVVESLVVDGYGEDGSAHIAVDRAGADRRVASADVAADGAVTDRIFGTAPNKDHAELRVAGYLVDHLNQLGADWQPPALVRANARNERGVDCISLSTSGRELLIQVTTTEREIWRQRQNVHERSATSQMVVKAIRAAIQAKATRADKKIVLALDATDSLRAAFRPIVDAFRIQHGAWAAGIGFQEIWLVGPVAALVHRLDDHD